MGKPLVPELHDIVKLWCITDEIRAHLGLESLGSQDAIGLLPQKLGLPGPTTNSWRGIVEYHRGRGPVAQASDIFLLVVAAHAGSNLSRGARYTERGLRVSAGKGPLPFLEVDQLPDELYSGRINRATGTIAQGTNRPYELVREGTVFRGRLTVLEWDDVRGWEFGKARYPSGRDRTPDQWLASGEWDAQRTLDELVIRRLEAITMIGGYRSKGFGAIKVTVRRG